ncbi:hypothetical protein [Prosthecomicrobium pneumaticum]|uniref:Uncharacterized protein n=1 Tax=Prosthecomicrobium pneumaticum TaxID=81895 RepID=A0A7W9CTJ5_9HYPH|nr:hypothetical protein [Prosthecomicrobium pneumaticum]MBB5751293.1 hypothetical protein [Prosthecomicrobium pneumaticum]
MQRRDGVTDLIEKCMLAHTAGADFPKVWREILSRSRLVIGVPVQRLEGARAILEIKLITGERLLCDPAGYALG